MDIPEHMVIVPHNYQLKGAAQLNYLCSSPAKGALLGDYMGLGKTLQAVLCMYLQRHEMGLSLVLCPASLCQQWINCIEGAF